MAVEVVEPTLVSDAGHCAAIFGSLFRAAPDLPYRLWIDRRAHAPSVIATGVETVRHFVRPLRRLQALLLYRRLLRGPGPLYVPTATWSDLRSIDLLARSPLPPDHVFLYFHKLRLSAGRREALRALARRQPHLHLLGASAEIADRLRDAGFRQVDAVIPVNAEVGAVQPGEVFRHVLFAGAARADKGFTHVVDWVEHLSGCGDALPVLVQTTGDHYGRHDDRTATDLVRLRAIDAAWLQTLDQTPDRLAYANLFPGSICLQPYDRREYADKTSSVTFDALMAGAPIVTLSGTPMARIVEESGAGRVVEDALPQTLQGAIEAIHADYAGYARRALAAGRRFDPRQAWQPLVDGLRRALASGGSGTAR
jgi:glycosyltransferase involved in cell wall biosynthesis